MSKTYYGLEDVVRALQGVLPLAERYLSGAKSHPDWDKIRDAKSILKEITESEEWRTRK